MKLSFHNLVAGIVAVGVLGAPPVGRATEPSAELLDLAGRVEYGFYTQEARAIESARMGLERLPGSSALQDYYVALAAYRTGLLLVSQGERGVGRWLTQCDELGRRAARDRELASEAWALVGACAAAGLRHGGGRSYFNDLEEALANAIEADSENPRIMVVGAWAISHRPAQEEAELRAEAQRRLERALELFSTWSTPFGFPDWGEAEALAHLGEIHLEAGDPRAARDFVEHALLVAPDYRLALTLQRRILSQ